MKLLKVMAAGGAALVMGSMVTMAQAEDIIAKDSVQWNATAIKNADARLTVTPLGSLNFKYQKDTKNFNSLEAPFKVVVDNTGLDASSFKLEARAGSQRTLRGGNGDSMQVALYADSEELVQGSSWVSLVDGDQHIDGLEGITGLGETIESGTSHFTAVTTNFKDSAGSDLTAENLPEGVYSGVVSSEFKATWTTGGIKS